MHPPQREKDLRAPNSEAASTADRTLPVDRPSAHVAFVPQPAAAGELAREGVALTAEDSAAADCFIFQLIVTDAYEIRFELHPIEKPQHLSFDVLTAVLERSRVLLMRHVLDDECLGLPIEC
ncbi:hypothetical protein ACA040_004640 [Xenophilus aerolatus]